MSASKKPLPASPSTSNFGGWNHFNAAGQLIASGVRWGDHPEEYAQQIHAPFPLPAIAPWYYLKDPQHHVRVSSEALVRNMLQCLELTYRC